MRVAHIVPWQSSATDSTCHTGNSSDLPHRDFGRREKARETCVQRAFLLRTELRYWIGIEDPANTVELSEPTTPTARLIAGPVAAFCGISISTT
jgi:hypothetical protein